MKMKSILFALAFMVMTAPVFGCDRIKHSPIKTSQARPSGQLNEAQRAAFEKSYMKETHQKVKVLG
jgi:hypothetical protein